MRLVIPATKGRLIEVPDSDADYWLALGFTHPTEEELPLAEAEIEPEPEPAKPAPKKTAAK